MAEAITADWTTQKQDPFGVVISSATVDGDLHSVPAGTLRDLIDAHRVIILRGFAPLVGTALPAYCERLGELLEWEFGTVNELRVKTGAQNYLYTDRAVPFHWDGAFAGRVPHYIFFQCEIAPPAGGGGETLFCDAIRFLELAPSERSELWERTDITYTTEKIVHYGGTFTAAMVSPHPVSGTPVLRYAEPVIDLNPVRLEITGLTAGQQSELLDDLHQRLNDPRVCYQHRWLTHDIVIADNHALLHGRNAFDGVVERHIRRVNIV